MALSGSIMPYQPLRVLQALRVISSYVPNSNLISFPLVSLSRSLKYPINSLSVPLPCPHTLSSPLQHPYLSPARTLIAPLPAPSSLPCAPLHLCPARTLTPRPHSHFSPARILISALPVPSPTPCPHSHPPPARTLISPHQSTSYPHQSAFSSPPAFFARLMYVFAMEITGDKSHRRSPRTSFMLQ